ncbi:probable xyloglucan galactosyltransferase GT19 [Typha latifolia]|uniref:probable xyloglucan galactosyltransferase GT19 n=1 Tax=Typha latifolia TaxID=4733 RepID=UPI003C2AC5D0
MAKLIFLLLFLLHPHRTRSDQSIEPGQDCSGRRIHILDLPSRFNADVLRHCAAFPLSDTSDFCSYLPNHGLGPRTHSSAQSWYRTDPRLFEPFFHRRLLLDYPCLSPDPNLSDAVFLPYYASLDALPFLYSAPLFNSSALHGQPLAEFLRSRFPRLLSRRLGHDFFLVLAGVAWDYSQDPNADPVSWGTSFLRLPDFVNFTILTIESRHWPWQEHAVPHPTSFHPSSLTRLTAWLSRAAKSPRPNLMLFAGGGATAAAAITPPSRPNIRASILAECANRTDLCALVDCSGGSCSHDPIRYMRPMLRARFCLQPPGDTPTRRSTFDAIVAGCIPVFFEDVSAKTQYGWHLPKSRFEEFSVLIPKEEVVFGGVKIADVLAALPEKRVRSMRARVLEMAPRVMYRRHGSSEDMRKTKDAFDLAIDGVLRRIKRRVRAIEDGGPDRIYYEDDDDDGGDEG